MVGIADFCSVGEESLFAFYMLQSFFYSLPEWEDGTNSLMKNLNVPKYIGKTTVYVWADCWAAGMQNQIE